MIMQYPAYQIESIPDGGGYLVDGRAVPRVTAVLKILEPYNGYPEGAAIRGTHVHKLCELYDLDDLDPGEVYPEYEGYLYGWVKFRREKPLYTGSVSLKYECKIASKKRVFAGTADRLSDEWIIDIKTGEPCRTHEHQLHAYNMAAVETYGGKRRGMLLVYLKPDGDYKLQIVKWDGAVWDMFLSALNVYNFRNGGKAS